jgi:hypothetical protein
MSQDNVEFVRRYYVKWNVGEMEEMAAALPEGIIIDLSRRKLDPEVLSGRDAALSFGRSKKAKQMGSARAAFGTPPRSGFAHLSGQATITGVGFFDGIHGQVGVAINGIELHPLLSIRNASCTRV